MRRRKGSRGRYWAVVISNYLAHIFSCLGFFNNAYLSRAIFFFFFFFKERLTRRNSLKENFVEILL